MDGKGCWSHNNKGESEAESGVNIAPKVPGARSKRKEPQGNQARTGGRERDSYGRSWGDES